MLNRKSFKSICFIVILVLLPFVPNQQPKAGSGNGEVAVNTTDSQVTDIGGDVVRQKAFLGNMKLIAENDVLELYFDETETDVAVRTKETGDIWFSNPLEASSDTIASVYYQNQMKSQFSIQYYNENVQSSEMDNFNDSIKKEQFEVSYEDMGVTISYTLGELASVMVLPGAISEEHMLLYTAKMEEGSSKKVLRNYTLLSLAAMDKTEQEKQLKAYPVLSEKNIYILKSGAKDYVKEEISGYFQEAGYTQTDKEQDAADCGITEENTKPWFKIPLTYTLEGENLLVSIDPKGVEYNTDGYYLVNIDLMKYFGAAGSNEEGYLFVPDGSGALIYLNNGKKNVPAYHAQVYGEDNSLTFMNDKKSEVNQNLTVKLPVFGLKTGNKAWYAVIEEGDGYAGIKAQVSGMVNSYNNVYAGFNYLQYGSISLDQIVGANSLQMYSEPEFIEKYQLRYAFLHGDEADYSGMAAGYRTYLLDREELVKIEVKDDAAFFVEFIGAIEKYKSFLGIKYQSTEALTTYSQAEKITELLKEANIGNIIVKYSGWSNGGLKGNAVTNIKPASHLNKGGVNIEEYLKAMKEADIPVYMDADFQTVYKDAIFDGYNELTYAPRYFDNTVVNYSEYNVSTGDLHKWIPLISPFYIDTVVDKFISKAGRYSLPGISIGKISSNLFSDLFPSRYTDKQMAISKYRSVLQKLDNEYENGLMGDNANAYVLGHVSSIVNVPMDTNHYLILDEAVPFYEIVIRGYMNYAGEPLNNTDDFVTTLLKSVESGADIYFQWIYDENSELVNSDFNYLYSVNYEGWLQKANETYDRVNNVYQGLQGQTIKNHEKLEAGVYKTTYEKGTELVVNYNKEAVTVNGITVGAKDFAVVKAGD